MQVAKGCTQKREEQNRIMGSERTIHTLLSVFDLKIIDGSNLEELASARIVFIFDQNKSLREFSIVDSKMPHEFQNKLRTWLEKNVDPAQIAGAINSNTLTVKADRETFGDVLLH
jgi:hypothetical protein